MRDFASQGLWPFPKAIFNFLFWNWSKTNGEKLVGFSSVRMLTWFSLIWSQFQFLVIIDYFLGKKHMKSIMLCALTQPEQVLLSNRYDTRTPQHMHNQTTSVRSSHWGIVTFSRRYF